MPTQIKNLVDSWPIVALILAILTTLVVTFFDDRVARIADRRIEAQIPISMTILKLNNRLLNMENSSGNHYSDIEDLEESMIRVEAKLDKLLFIMSTP